MKPPSAPRGRALLAGLLLCAACNVPGARMHNLRELHEDSGRHALSASLVSGPEYYLRFGLEDVLGGAPVEIGRRHERAVKKPLAECLENASALAEIESDDERVRAAQVALFAWLAVDDPWNLTREVCVKALGPHGRRLAVEVGAPRAEPPAGVAEVRDALARLVAAVRAEFGAGALDSACAAIEALSLDRQGALRLLRGAAALVGAVPAGSGRERLERTVLALERICVREALLAALKDEPPADAIGTHPGWRSPRVRAAAARACVQAFGDGAQAELLLQLDREPTDEVLCAVLGTVTRHGLPEPAEALAPDARARLTERWIATLLALAFDHPSGTVRVAAMRALARVSGERPSLREETWLAWDRERRGAAAPEPGVP